MSCFVFLQRKRHKLANSQLYDGMKDEMTGLVERTVRGRKQSRTGLRPVGSESPVESLNLSASFQPRVFVFSLSLSLFLRQLLQLFPISVAFAAGCPDALLLLLLLLLLQWPAMHRPAFRDVAP